MARPLRHRGDDRARELSAYMVRVVFIALALSGLCAIGGYGVFSSPLGSAHGGRWGQAHRMDPSAARLEDNNFIGRMSLMVPEASLSSLSERSRPGEPSSSSVETGPTASRTFSVPDMSNGFVWTDNNGTDIQAHGGFILFHLGTYWWYGEVKLATTETAEERDQEGATPTVSGGVAAYKSTDLKVWSFAGIALPVSSDPAASGDLRATRIVERPRVLYNAARKIFTMWLHIDSPNYSDARVGVAVSPTPEGPFQYRGSFRPNSHESRDFTVFQDEDGAAYLIYSSDMNTNLNLARMTNDFLSLESSFVVLPGFEGQRREAPILWKFKGLYYMWTSGCTGWEPNKARLSIAARPGGPWHPWGSPPCSSSYTGAGAGASSSSSSSSSLLAVDGAHSDSDCATTFQSQGTCVLPWPGASRNSSVGVFLWAADRWRPEKLPSSGYVWLRMTITDPSSPTTTRLRSRMKGIRVEIAWSHHVWDL